MESKVSGERLIGNPNLKIIARLAAHPPRAPAMPRPHHTRVVSSMTPFAHASRSTGIVHGPRGTERRSR